MRILYRVLLCDDYLSNLDFNLLIFVYLAKYPGHCESGNRAGGASHSFPIYSHLFLGTLQEGDLLLPSVVYVVEKKVTDSPSYAAEEKL